MEQKKILLLLVSLFNNKAPSFFMHKICKVAVCALNWSRGMDLNHHDRNVGGFSVRTFAEVVFSKTSIWVPLRLPFRHLSILLRGVGFEPTIQSVFFFVHRRCQCQPRHLLQINFCLTTWRSTHIDGKDRTRTCDLGVNSSNVKLQLKILSNLNYYALYPAELPSQSLIEPQDSHLREQGMGSCMHPLPPSLYHTD